ncbi:hypothetical protein [Candidatus Pantoea multigeneris]|uniref:Uncharacterized protein n=1 Tax=Candidatus Pantoea multigeneris TaxID=2608357 RepID=A0ABX0REW8_9GAMM|nr:hypothetical protein [Pantoea multigeneris]NIF22952.1 hypothetical protein [Pantoea multigeneris]
MKLKLATNYAELSEKLDAIAKDDRVDNQEVISFAVEADKLANGLEITYKDQNLLTSLQKGVDDLSDQLQKIGIAVLKNKLSAEEKERVDKLVQFQLAQLIVNYNRVLGK